MCGVSTVDRAALHGSIIVAWCACTPIHTARIWRDLMYLHAWLGGLDIFRATLLIPTLVKSRFNRENRFHYTRLETLQFAQIVSLGVFT